jgi:hypothetical protein
MNPAIIARAHVPRISIVWLVGPMNNCSAPTVMDIRPFYAALLGMLFFVLSVGTLRLRRKLQIAIGDAGNQQLLRAMRIHSNFAGERRACGSFSHG